MAAMALGFTMPDGLEPALYAFTFLPPRIFAKAWLIWERLLFSTQTKSNFFFIFVKYNFSQITRICTDFFTWQSEEYDSQNSFKTRGRSPLLFF
jgi:hypothetical protein